MRKIVLMAAALAATSGMASAQMAPTGQYRQQGQYRPHRGGGLFSQADTNHDGVVSQAEMQAAFTARMQMRDLRMRAREQQREAEIFRMMDTNHDGVISKAEAQAARPMLRQMRERRMAERQARMQSGQMGR